MEYMYVILIALSFLCLILFLVIILRPKNTDNSSFRVISEAQDRVERTLREELARNREETARALTENAKMQEQQMKALREEVSRFGHGNELKLEALRETVDRKLKEIQQDNGSKLENIRKTVDEKLHETLERRLGESFKLVGERLELVQSGLGEMKSLAAGVGDLKRVLVNVKNRGNWGEVQLISLVEDLLVPSQYELNAKVRAETNERVELAIKLPGKEQDGSKPVWLPVDAKFPKEDYERLLEARDNGDMQRAEDAAKMLERRFKLSAKDINEKYIAPPETTDFAVMFLPSEALFAECLSRAGLSDFLQRNYRVVVAGPSSLAAMLNSLQMGFRSLAVEKRTTEIWRTLGLVKEEFSKFGSILEKTKKKLQEAADTVDIADRKTRTIRGKLDKVEGLQGTDYLGQD